RPVKVPENSYFVLGDNSLSSRDSRYWGFVPKKYMVGKAFVRWWPLTRMGRIDRIFESDPTE
ncbi:MAG: signal peptidase I, partial [Candidatus Omnitrophota bacterium]